jgi:hypothetical protein
MRIFALALLLAGCEAHVGLSNSLTTLPKDAAATCGSYCGQMGLTLSSVVVMANNVGCVCSPKNATVSTGGAAAGGMAAILIQEEEERERVQQR